MNLKRQSGVLLHPTSLPETPGIGTIGKQAYKFVDWLVSAKQSIWQILPYGPTGYGDSPYASFSTFAGNPLLIDIELLVESGCLTQEQANPPEWIKSEGYVDFGSVVWWKIPLLKLAAKQFLESAQNEEKAQYQVFIEKEKYWLDNYALFMSIKEFYDQKAKENAAAHCGFGCTGRAAGVTAARRSVAASVVCALSSCRLRHSAGRPPRHPQPGSL